MAKTEDLGAYFLSPDYKKAKILWLEGGAIGYYVSDKTLGKPCLRQIYVTPNDRRKGYGKQLWNHFLDNHIKVIIEQPNENMIKLLLKLNLVQDARA